MGFCPKCGKDVEHLIEGICEKCYMESHSLLDSFKDLNLNVCVQCDAKAIANRWDKKDLDKAVEQLVRKQMKITQGAEISSLETELSLPDQKTGPGVKVLGEVIVSVAGRFSSEQKEDVLEEFTLPITLFHTICTNCAKEKSKYFEAILQLRSDRKDILDFIKKEVDKTDNFFITKEEKLKHGYDFYLTSNQMTHALGHSLRKAFGGVIKTNSKLFSKDNQTSKELHRLTVLFRPFDFRERDVVVFKDKIFKLVKMGKEVLGRDVATGKVTLLDTDKAVPEKIEPLESSVTIVRPRVEVLHPETYQSTPVENKKIDVKEGQKVSVVLFQERLFIV